MTGTLSGVTYGYSTFLAVGYASNIPTAVMFTSPDGVIWTQRSSGLKGAPLTGVTYGNNTFIALSSGILQSDPVGPLAPVNGQCGPSNGETFTTAPSTNLCNAGTATAVTGTGPWSWTCAGSDGGSAASCSAFLRFVPDFNADGKPDLVWRNTATGQNAVWYMNGVTFSQGVCASIPSPI